MRTLVIFLLLPLVGCSANGFCDSLANRYFLSTSSNGQARLVDSTTGKTWELSNDRKGVWTPMIFECGQNSPENKMVINASFTPDCKNSFLTAKETSK